MENQSQSKQPTYVGQPPERLVLTQNSLQKRGFMLCSRCYLSEEERESVEHLFLHCRVSRLCWELFLNFTDVSWVMPLKIRSLLDCWQYQRISRNLKQMWKIIPICILETIRLERNNACFEGKRRHISRINNNCLQNLYILLV